MGQSPDPIELESPEWKVQRAETVKAFEAFTAYLEMGPERSLEKLRRALGLNTSRHLKDWSVKYRWQDRIKAWIDHEADKRRLTAREELLRFIERDRQLQQAVLSVSVSMLQKANQRLAEMEDIRDQDLPAFIRAAVAAAQKAEETQMTILGVDEVLDFLDDLETE